MPSLLDSVDISLRDWKFERFYHTPLTPHYHLVPKEEQANRRWRKRLRELGASSPEQAAQIVRMCAEDLLFYINSFCYTFSPKDFPDDPHRPFITWPFQDDAMLRIIQALGKKDVAIAKSRDMGATWMCIAALEHRWHFRHGQTFLFTSRKEEFVDKRRSPKELFWKLDYLHKNQPAWLLPTGREMGWDDPNRIKMHVENADTGSVIDGEATVGNLGRGDRLTGILLDEHAAMRDTELISKSTRDATKTRIFNSTPAGTAGDAAEFYKQCHNPANEIIVLHWSLHPEKAKGLYRWLPENEQPTFYDGYEFPDGYEFIHDGKWRSPWYDNECTRATSVSEIAQELDIDFLKSGWPFFDANLVESLLGKTIAPKQQGFLEENSKGELEFIPSDKGPLKLWFEGKPKKDGRYVVGCDIAAGAGGEYSSNSVASVADTQGRKVAEFASNEVAPADFARIAVHLCMWFNDALLGWEANGFGMAFGKTVMKTIGYGRVYMRQIQDGLIEKRQKKPGWWSGPREKRILLVQYQESLKSGKFVNPSSEAITECGEYIHAPDGTIVHDKSRTADSSTATGENHGDRVIADALTDKLAREFLDHVEQEPEQQAPPGSFLWRRQRRQRIAATEEAW